MDKVVYKGYVDKLYELTNGTHKLLPSFQKQINKPWIIGYWPEKLLSALKIYYRENPEVIMVPEPTKEHQLPEKKASWHITSSDPEEIIFLKNSAKKLHKEEALLHAQLCRSRSQDVRYNLALKICSIIGPELDRLYGEIKKYNATGVIPITAKKVEKIADVNDLYNKLNSLNSRISRLKKLIPNSSGEKLEKYQKEEIIKLQLIEEIKSKLGE